MPRIGLISDSHASAAITGRAAALLADRGAEMLLHLGDICSEPVLDALLAPAPGAGSPLPVHIVFGNMDFETESLGRYARRLGIEVDHPAGRLDCGAARLAFMHGHEKSPVLAALEEGVDYLCYGHTHVAADERHGKTRMINPGALYRTPAPSVALLDTGTDTLEKVAVPKG